MFLCCSLLLLPLEKEIDHWRGRGGSGRGGAKQ